MQWGVLSSIFILSTFKFMFAAIPGGIAGVPFWQTYVTTVAGGITGAAIFYFGAEFFIKLNHKKLVRKRLEAEKNGIVFQEKKKFTRLNKFVVRIKWKLGLYGICFWAPFFLSVPIGSIISAKFYGKQKITFFLISLGMLMNGSVTTTLSYIFN